jgi:hypothetical protein
MVLEVAEQVPKPLAATALATTHMARPAALAVIVVASVMIPSAAAVTTLVRLAVLAVDLAQTTHTETLLKLVGEARGETMSLV